MRQPFWELQVQDPDIEAKGGLTVLSSFVFRAEGGAHAYEMRVYDSIEDGASPLPLE